MEEAYKRKNNQVFVWRFLREISFIDLVNFLGRPEANQDKSKQQFVFEGDAEEQARILFNSKHNAFKKCEINFKVLNAGNAASTDPQQPNADDH
jgi:hypothetical protein